MFWVEYPSYALSTWLPKIINSFSIFTSKVGIPSALETLVAPLFVNVPPFTVICPPTALDTIIVPPAGDGGKPIKWSNLPPVMPEQDIKVYGTLDNDILGDVNGDDDISVIDAILVMRHTINSNTLTPEQILVADVDSNGIVDIVDAILIQRYVIGMISSFK